MIQRNLRVLLAGLLIVGIAMLAGCGSGGSLQTSGVLAIDTPAASNGVVTAKATYSVPMPNIPIKFQYYYVGQTTNTITPPAGAAGPSEITINSAGDGSATFNFTFNPGRTENNTFYVRAVYDGLVSGWQSVVVVP